jgi:hypothetical protein
LAMAFAQLTYRKQQLTKRQPTDTVHCTCGKYVWQG